jgi:hypothetical protein
MPNRWFASSFGALEALDRTSRRGSFQLTSGRIQWCSPCQVIQRVRKRAVGG